MGPPDQYQEGDIIEPEEWRNPEQQAFNHQALVMQAMRKCIENGSTEMREGYFNEKVDRFGNVRREWVCDTRKVFIESVKSLLMIIIPDFDDEANKKVKETLDKIEERKKFWLAEEWAWWIKLNPTQQQQLSKEGKHVIQGFFNTKLSFDNYFYEEELNLYRDICAECNELTKRKDYYGEIGYMA